MNALSCGVKVWAEVSFILSQSTRLTDRRTPTRGRTDGRTDTHFVRGYDRSALMRRGKNQNPATPDGIRLRLLFVKPAVYFLSR